MKPAKASIMYFLHLNPSFVEESTLSPKHINILCEINKNNYKMLVFVRSMMLCSVTGYVPAEEPADSKTSYLYLVSVLGSVIVFVVIILVVIIILICRRTHERVHPDPDSEKSGTQPSDADEQIQPLIDGVTDGQPTTGNGEPMSAEPNDQPEITHSKEDVSSGHDDRSDHTGNNY